MTTTPIVRRLAGVAAVLCLAACAGAPTAPVAEIAPSPAAHLSPVAARASQPPAADDDDGDDTPARTGHLMSSGRTR